MVFSYSRARPRIHPQWINGNRRTRALSDEFSSSSTRDNAVVFRGDAFGRLQNEKTREMFAASVISSVIALAKAENGSEQTKADERIRKR
jgi:hypothetical protein